MAAGTDHAHTNRLSAETSPYLLQHAHNPVDWHAWGPEAFAAARAQNKPIFLSVGYSTCYWCHVMERQSFENERVAGEMNARFINIKVDREERPDVDQLYMMAVQVLTRHGGWPMSVFLTPDLRPFYGGTYFPPTDQQGRPGFITLMKGIEDAYRNRPQDVEKTANQLVDILKQLAQPAPPDSAIAINAAFIDSQVARAISDYDAEHGGFGSAPKFPRQTLLELLLRYIDEDPNQPTSTAQGDTARFKEQVRRRLFHTLDALAAGGIRDHLGGGFHRYSTDAQWLVPHFEIMLYDNAMLAWIYVDAYRQSENRQYAAVARGILDFVLREMTSSSGAFYTALDAEVDAREGLSYLWTAEEVEALLGKTDARIFSKVYGLDEGPNFADPHHGPGHPDTNILYMPDTLEDIVEEISKIDVSIRSTDDLEKRLAAMRQTLY
ncbi:MAG TPA: thioredoxin domain-containing protein, partial [Tepidisphaeraceae bacterium]